MRGGGLLSSLSRFGTARFVGKILLGFIQFSCRKVYSNLTRINNTLTDQALT